MPRCYMVKKACNKYQSPAKDTLWSPPEPVVPEPLPDPPPEHRKYTTHIISHNEQAII